MPATTPANGLPYPLGSEVPDVPRDVQALAEGVEAALLSSFSRTITAGNGLVGGGDLTTSRTVAVGAGAGISVLADTVNVDTTWADARYPVRSGSSMTGPLALPAAAPTNDLHAAHKGYVDSRIWFGTQAAYDAIGTKDSSVLYVISG